MDWVVPGLSQHRLPIVATSRVGVSRNLRFSIPFPSYGPTWTKSSLDLNARKKRETSALPGSADVSERSARLFLDGTERTQSTSKRGSSLDPARGPPSREVARTLRNLSEVSIDGLGSSSQPLILTLAEGVCTLCGACSLDIHYVHEEGYPASWFRLHEDPQGWCLAILEGGRGGLRKEEIRPLIARASVQ